MKHRQVFIIDSEISLTAAHIKELLDTITTSMPFEVAEITQFFSKETLRNKVVNSKYKTPGMEP